jgi:hypothetical protein
LDEPFILKELQVQRKLKRWLTLLILITTPFAVFSAEMEDGQALRIVKEAWKASQENLRSGRGSGTYVAYVAKPGESSMKLVSEAKVKVDFNDGAYRVELHYTKESFGMSKRTIIYDRSAVLASMFSDRISPKNAMGEVYKESMGDGPSIAGFPWNVRKLPSAIIDFDRVAKRYGSDAVRVEEKNGGLLEGRYRLNKYIGVVFVAPKESGFNITSLKAEREGSQHPSQEYIVEWKKTAGVWIINSFVETVGEPDDRELLRTREEFRYDDFEPNAKVSPKLFTIDALELPDGARFLDQRPEATQREWFYRKPANNASLDTLLASVKALPTSRVDIPAKPTSSRFWLVLSGAALLGTLAILLFYNTRRGRPAE